MTALTTATCFGVVFVLFLALSVLLYFRAAKGLFKSVLGTEDNPEHRVPTIVESFFGNMFWVAVVGMCSGVSLVGFVVSLCFHFFG